LLKKFRDGVIFGGGFALGVAVVWCVWTFGMAYFMPRILAPKEDKDFSFFNHSKKRMEIPPGGGILAMSPMTSAKGASRPSTYQLWLTESKLWQIRTVEDKVEIEELPYPANASVQNVDELMRKNLGFAARQSTMTVSSHDVSRLKSRGESSRDDSLNGTMKISTEGVVFVQPNAWEPGR
jgi:hypothetical protein